MYPDILMKLSMQIILATLLLFITIEASWITRRECDEELTGPIGVLHFTDPYKTLKSWTIYCEYNITVDGSNKIALTIPLISINSTANSTDCGDSYISLKDGLDRSSPPLGLGKYCGNEEVGALTTTGNQLHIRTAIELGLGAHYMMTYQKKFLRCGGIFELTPETLNRTIEKEGRHISECAWIFIAPADHVLSIAPKQCEDVSVEMRNGGTNLSPLISQICSTNDTKIITTNNLLYVRIQTDSGKGYTSFQADITAVKNTCGGTLRVDNGVIISPNYPFNSPNKVCSWKIIAPRKKRIQFQFHDLHLSESSNCEQRNYLRINERMLENGTHRVLGTFCGSATPGIIKTSCNKAEIQFHSDYHNIGHFRGFVLNFTTIDEPCVVNCGGILTSDNGIISSPNFPDEYQSNQNCKWKIDLSSKKRIKFQFVRVIIDDNPLCNEDYVLITEMINGTESALGRYCNDSNTMPISTSSSVAEVIFHFNDKNEDAGFILSYFAIDESPCDNASSQPSAVSPSYNYPDHPTSHTVDEIPKVECGGVLTEPMGTIISPKYSDKFFGHEVKCVWTIQASPDEAIELNWSAFSTEGDDYVELVETNWLSSNHKHGRYGGSEIPPGTVTLTGSSLEVIFHSKYAVNEPNFEAYYSFIRGTRFYY